MTKTTEGDFEFFKAEFKHWINWFGLKGWQIYYLHASLDGQYSRIILCSEYRTATVTLCTEYDESDACPIDIPHIAKHEAIHLLIGELCEAAENRWTTQHEVNAIEEELVNRLMALIKQ